MGRQTRDRMSGEPVYELPPLKQVLSHKSADGDVVLLGLDKNGELWEHREADPKRRGSKPVWLKLTKRCKDGTSRYTEHRNRRRGLHDERDDEDDNGRRRYYDDDGD